MKNLWFVILAIGLLPACSDVFPEKIIVGKETLAPTPFPFPTLPPECGTTTFGNPGTQTKENNPPVLVEGMVILCNYGSLFDEYPALIPLKEAILDLDTGLASTENGDIGFGVSGIMQFYGINAIHNARASIWSLNGITGEHAPQPSFDDCKQLVNIYDNDNEPEYVCVITDQEHIARIKVEKYNPIQQVPSLQISFITWK